MTMEAAVLAALIACFVLIFLSILIGGSRSADRALIDELEEANDNLRDQRNAAEQERERALVELARRKGQL